MRGIHLSLISEIRRVRRASQIKRLLPAFINAPFLCAPQETPNEATLCVPRTYLVGACSLIALARCARTADGTVNELRALQVRKNAWRTRAQHQGEHFTEPLHTEES